MKPIDSFEANREIHSLITELRSRFPVVGRGVYKTENRPVEERNVDG